MLNVVFMCFFFIRHQLLITAFLKQVWYSQKFWLFDPYSEVKLSIIPLFNVPNLRQLLFTFLFASFWNWSNILLETVFWSELRFDEGGRYVVCSLNKNEKDFKVWTPKQCPDQSPRVWRRCILCVWWSGLLLQLLGSTDVCAEITRFFSRSNHSKGL